MEFASPMSTQEVLLGSEGAVLPDTVYAPYNSDRRMQTTGYTVRWCGVQPEGRYSIQNEDVWCCYRRPGATQSG